MNFDRPRKRVEHALLARIGAGQLSVNGDVPINDLRAQLQLPTVVLSTVLRALRDRGARLGGTSLVIDGGGPVRSFWLADDERDPHAARVRRLLNVELVAGRLQPRDAIVVPHVARRLGAKTDAVRDGVRMVHAARTPIGDTGLEVISGDGITFGVGHRGQTPLESAPTQVRWHLTDRIIAGELAADDAIDSMVIATKLAIAQGSVLGCLRTLCDENVTLGGTGLFVLAGGGRDTPYAIGGAPA